MCARFAPLRVWGARLPNWTTVRFGNFKILSLDYAPGYGCDIDFRLQFSGKISNCMLKILFFGCKRSLNFNRFVYFVLFYELCYYFYFYVNGSIYSDRNVNINILYST